MTPLNMVAIFLMLIGAEKGQGILAQMDNGEIKAVVPAIRRLKAVPREVQETVWAEFTGLGYEDNMKPSEALTVIRFIFNGGRISDRSGR